MEQLETKLGNFEDGYVTFDDNNGNIEQVNHYYPFGGLMAESTGDVQPYKYNGKELDRMHGLDCYDYGARWMSDGRFTTQDPHAFYYTAIRPYAYCGNNPIAYLDRNDSVYYAQDGLELYRYGSDHSITYVFVIKTFQSTNSMYSESNPGQKGNVNSISEKDYIKTRDEIMQGNIQGEHMQNITLFGTTSELNSAYKSIKDNGRRGSISSNYKEYSGSFTEKDIKNIKVGASGDPSKNSRLVSNGNSDYHSHPSGENGKYNEVLFFIILGMLLVSQKVVSQKVYQDIYSDIVYRIYIGEKGKMSKNDTIYFLTDSKHVSYKVDIKQVGKLNQEPADNREKGNCIYGAFSLGEPKVRRKSITIVVSSMGASYKEGNLHYYVGGWLIFKYIYNRRKHRYEFSSFKEYGI